MNAAKKTWTKPKLIRLSEKDVRGKNNANPAEGGSGGGKGPS